MRRKTRDPVLIALLDEQHKTSNQYEQWFFRMKRAVTRMDRLRKKLLRLAKKIHEHENPKEES